MNLTNILARHKVHVSLIRTSFVYIESYMSGHVLLDLLSTPDRRQSKTLILSTNVDTKSLGTEFSIVIRATHGN